MGEDEVLCCGDKDESEGEHGPPAVMSLIPLDFFGLAGGPSGSTSETGVGEVGVVCCGDEGEGEGERGAPDGLSLVPLGVFVLRCPPLFRDFAGFGTFASSKRDAAVAAAETGFLASLSSG